MAGASHTETSQELAVAARAFGRGAHARQHVLFDDDPVVVAMIAELAQHRAKVHGAAAELAENPLPHRLEVVPRPAARAVEDARIEILEVHVPDAGGVAAVNLERVAAAEHEMAGVEAEADE